MAAVTIFIFAAYLWPWYNSVKPTLFGLPFFYWWVIVMYVVGSVLLWVYASVSGERGLSRSETQGREGK